MAKNKNLHGNFKISKDCVSLSINPKIYPLQVVHAAAYMMIDRAYVIIDGNPEEELIIEIRPKEKQDLRKMGYEFSNELLNYAVYYNQSKMNKGVREAIIQRAFLTNMSPPAQVKDTCDKPEKFKGGYVKDPLGISKPWKPRKGKVKR